MTPTEAASHTNIHGTWSLSKDQSRLGAMTGFTSMTMTVTEKGRLLTIEENVVGPGHEKATAYECKFDGRYHPVQGGDQGAIKCKWDGNMPVRDHQWNDGKNEEQMRIGLAADGSLIEDVVVTGPQGAVDNRTLVWKRA